ncbi:MAG: beta-ketoacyl-[acyl-carrier-protein] synthase family protein [Chitinispirillaceae bacterium]|nr:beta-ketoacyl-[acyl-carrier-protein] synthase family protein [Chitinispirillaceae bacterium]
MERKRVVVTGMGIITPIGSGIDKFWRAAVNGTNGVRPLTKIDTTDFRTKTGGEVLDFNPDDHFSREEISSMGMSSLFAIAATKMAIEDAKNPLSFYESSRIGVSIGTTMGEPGILEKGIRIKYAEKGDISKIPPDLPRQYPSANLSFNISKYFSLSGPTFMIPTACAAGNYAIGYAFDMIKNGRIDAAVVGGSDSFSVIPFTGFNRLLATTPDVVRPFDKNRQGMAVSEGAGIMIIEELNNAKKRGAPIYAEILGYGLGCDAYKMTIPDPEGSGGIIALKRALENSNIPPEKVDYISAHGTGTIENDKVETLIVKRVFGEHSKKVKMASLKSMIGHTMGAASAIEAVSCVLMIKHQIALPTINYSEPDPECDIDCVPNKAIQMKIETVVSNAYAFAGNTSSIVLSSYKD